MKKQTLIVLLMLAPALCWGQLFKNDTTGAMVQGRGGLSKGGRLDTASATVTFAYDASSSKAATAASTVHKFAHTCTGTATKGALIVGFSVGSCDGTITNYTATYGAQSMTAVGVSKNTGECLETYLFKLMKPHTGTDTVTITLNTAKSISMGAVSWRGVSSVSSATTANGVSTTASVDYSGMPAGRVGLACIVAGTGQSLEALDDNTEAWQVTETVGNKPGQMNYTSLPVWIGSNLLAGTDGWAIIAVQLIP